MQFTVLTANDTWPMTIQSQYVRIMPFELVSSRIRTFILGSWKAWSFATALDEKESRLEELALRVKEHPFLRQKTPVSSSLKCTNILDTNSIIVK